MDFKDKTCLVTGGAGFSPSYVAEALAKQGAKVLILDNLSYGFKENIEHFENEFHKGDIREKEPLESLVKRSDFVFHMVTHSFLRDEGDYKSSIDINITGTLNVLDACRRHDKNVLYTSSASVYGNPTHVPVKETDAFSPSSYYAITKLAGEYYFRLYHKLYSLPIWMVRYFNLYGARQREDSPYSGVISVFAKKLALGEPLTIYGDGTQTRDFTYVLDAADATLLVASRKDAINKIYNIGSGKETKVNELAKIMMEISGKQVKMEYEKGRQIDNIQRRVADISKIKDLGWEPKTPLEQGLKEVIEEFKKKYPKE